jgi:DNA polymerase elongation subunit (family B)
MKEWARSRGAFAEHLELDVDDVYSRFYIGDKKKRYFGNRIYDGEPCDDFKVRGFETRQGSWPEPVRELQEELMHALLDDEPTGPIVSRYKDELFKGLHDDELHESKKLGQPVDDYPHPMPHTRAAEAIREEYGDGAVQVDDKVDYIKYGDGKTDVVHVHDGIGAEFRPNDHYCPECDKVVRGDHEHETAGHPHLRDEHYSYIWEEKYLSVMGSIGVSEHEQTGLGAFA